MNVMERAILYITRKKGKTFVMFCILFVMASAIISGISIKKAAQTSMQQTRESLGGNFSMGLNYDESNPNIKRVEEKSEFGVGIQLENTGPPLSEELAEQVASVEGIKGFNGYGMMRIDEDDIDYLEPDKNASNGFSFSGNTAGDLMNLQVSVDMHSQLDTLFQNGTIKLSEGRHITREDKQKILLHKDLAEKNGWKLGDLVPLRLSEEERKEKGINEAYIECEIIGLFETASNGENAFLPFMMPENNMIIDIDTGKKLSGKDSMEFENLTFYVSDPKLMDTIVEQVKQLDIDWNQFTLDTNDAQYQSIAGSIEQLDDMITIIMYAVLLVSGVILTLILSLWIKARIYETGVLLSMGISKRQIVIQYIAELMIIAILAFGLSYLSGSVISQSLSDSLISSSQNQNQGQNGTFTTSAISIKGGTSNNSDAIEELDVSVTLRELGLVYVIGSGLIVVSVILSSAGVLRLKPKEILSKMS